MCVHEWCVAQCSRFDSQIQRRCRWSSGECEFWFFFVKTWVWMQSARSIHSQQVAYTFDAGPNACIYLLEKEVPKFLSFLNIIYPNDELPPQEYIRGIPVELKTLKDTVSWWDPLWRAGPFWQHFLFRWHSQERNAFGPNIPFARNVFKYIIHTRIGDGPRRLDDSESLIEKDGTPKSLKIDEDQME